jgi:hypothetical protein
MKRVLQVTLFAAALTVAGLIPGESQAFHRRSASRCEVASCGTACATSCAEPCAVAAPTPPKMVEVKVTKYKQEWKDQEVITHVCKMVPREEKYNYAVYVPVTKTEKRKVTHYERVSKEVAYNYTVLVPKTYQEKRTVNYCEYETHLIKEVVPVCRRVRVETVDNCGRCCYTWQSVTENVEVTRCVRKPIMKSREVVYNVVRCEQEVRAGKRTVYDCVPVVREVDVSICHLERQERQGTRTVCEYKTEAVKSMVKVCHLVAYTETVMVPEYQPACYSTYQPVRGCR